MIQNIQNDFIRRVILVLSGIIMCFLYVFVAGIFDGMVEGWRNWLNTYENDIKRIW